MQEFVSFVNSILWSNFLIYLCLGAGLYFSLKTKFLQVRFIKDMLSLIIKPKGSKTGVSSFQAFAMSIAGRVGTGNIAGVATAIAFGGPGSIFWMWVVAFFGAATSFIECTLAQIYKEKHDNEFHGGPAYYFTKGLNKKWYGMLFAITITIAYGLLLTEVQSNSIAVAFNTALNVPPILSSIAVCIAFAIIIFGGVKRIAHIAEFVVPFMAIAYILIAFIIIIANISQLPSIIVLIIKSAFGANQAFAGILGSAISWGVRRGIYSNESGQGTAPHAAAAADVSHPAKQGFVQAFSVYIDTLIVCSATAFMILITGTYNVYDSAGKYIVNNIGQTEIGPVFTQLAIDSVVNNTGAIFVAIALFFFAFTTLIFIAYVAETNIVYIFNSSKKVVYTLRTLLIISTFYGGINASKLIWGIADIGVGMIVYLNIIGILLLSGIAIKTLKDYEEQKKMGLDPVFNPKKLGIKNATFWETYSKE